MPSTTATGSPKAMLAMAAEVYVADSGEFAQFFSGTGENSLVFVDDHLRRLVHHPGAAVVAETAPGSQDVGFFRLGEGGYRGEKG